MRGNLPAGNASRFDSLHYTHGRIDSLGWTGIPGAVSGRDYSAATQLLWVLVAAILAAVIAAFATVHLLRPADTAAPLAGSGQFPLTQAVDSFTCPKGLTRIALQRGIEDGFAPTGEEPARIDPRLLRNGYFADLADPAASTFGLRAYDQGGADMVLSDHFIVPRGIVSGKLVMRIAKAAAGADNDGIRIGNLDYLGHHEGTQTDAFQGIDLLWSVADLSLLSDGSSLASIDLAQLHNWPRPSGKEATLLDYLNRIDRAPDVDLIVTDDTKVDALALLACQLPAQAKGVTFSEHRIKALGGDVSVLSCGLDPTQRSCNPFAGNRLCSAPGPIACYRDGSRALPPGMREVGLVATSFVGGEVRLSTPVRADRFAHLGAANAYCQQQFGREWRVLSYHEGGGGQVVSYSQIPPQANALVNIRDQQYGNCWDRDLKR